jgi:hypothetical protein
MRVAGVAGASPASRLMRCASAAVAGRRGGQAWAVEAAGSMGEHSGTGGPSLAGPDLLGEVVRVVEVDQRAAHV